LDAYVIAGLGYAAYQLLKKPKLVLNTDVKPNDYNFASTSIALNPVAPLTGTTEVKQQAQTYKLYWSKRYAQYAGKKLTTEQQNQLAKLLSVDIAKPFSFAEWNERQSMLICLKSAFDLGKWQFEIAPIVNGNLYTSYQDKGGFHGFTITKAPYNGLLLNVEPRHVVFTPKLPSNTPWTGTFQAYMGKMEYESKSPGVFGTIANLYDSAHDLAISINWTAVLVSLAAVGVVVITGGVAAAGLAPVLGPTGALLSECAAAAAVAEEGRQALGKYVTVG